MGPGRRDRRGRGVRGPLIPSDAPGSRTRAQRFDEVALECVEALGDRWRDAMPNLEFRVEDVPAADPAPWEARAAPLGRFVPATPQHPPVVVLYRRPIEAHCGEDVELRELLSLIVVQNVAHALGVAPEDVDPRFG